MMKNLPEPLLSWVPLAKQKLVNNIIPLCDARQYYCFHYTFLIVWQTIVVIFKFY